MSDDPTPERLAAMRRDSTPVDVWQDRRIHALIDALESAREESEARRLDIIRQCDARDATEAKLAKVRELMDYPDRLYDGNDYGCDAVEVADLRAVLDREDDQ